MMPNEKISVVTVVYNAKTLIEKTIQSIICQTYKNIEYIIVDGGSTDGTLDTIKIYESKVDILLSEKDNGIYDAMNKGIRLASGTWIIFINAGDVFYDSEVLSNIFNNKIYSQNDKVLYGSTLMRYVFGEYIVLPDNPNKLVKCMPFCHQSVICRVDAIKDFYFNSNLKIAADRDLLFKIYEKYPNSFCQYLGIISNYDARDGVSAKYLLKGYQEGKKITASEYSFPKRLRLFLRAYLPDSLLIPLYRVFFLFNKRYKRTK